MLTLSFDHLLYPLSNGPPVCTPQELASAERMKRQAQLERDELQDEINSQASKK